MSQKIDNSSNLQIAAVLLLNKEVCRGKQASHQVLRGLQAAMWHFENSADIS